MSNGAKRIACIMEPLDVLFFRDGRPFGPATRGESSALPTPQTLAGALTTALLAAHGCDFEQLSSAIKGGVSWPNVLGQLKLPDTIAQVRFRGPWPARVGNSDHATPQVLVPTPALLHKPAKSETPADFVCLRPAPCEIPGWNQSPRWPPAELTPLMAPGYGPTEPAGHWLTLDGLQKLLQGEIPSPNETWVHSRELFEWDYRTGVGIDASSQTAEEGLIYAARFVAMRQRPGEPRQVVLYAEVEAPGDIEQKLREIQSIALGGEAKRVALRWLHQPVAWPAASTDSKNDAYLVVLTTPGIFQLGWVPAVIEQQVVAAAVPDPLPTSGWDLARGGPKPLRWAAPGGSTWLVKSPISEEFFSLSDAPEDQRLGWGCFVQGVCP
ncbi:MAG: hypothetical protein KatS3mg110_3068 [Pirellulaceae bacterium]|nr:MAG: hypothetical protein KatS3mg110_3068 [Pirellulaceae bacterium]